MEAVVSQAVSQAVNQASLAPICKRPDVLDNKYLQHLAISENGFVFDPSTGKSFTVNETGVELLKLFLQENNIDVIVNEQHKKYKTDSREIERDILEFASSLNRHFYL
ncbi:MAG: PqqD family protein [Ectothiorhodospiraceae bacterium]|nr:PqqD family protein [Ectothiorhodospiraceae bacterium]